MDWRKRLRWLWTRHHKSADSHNDPKANDIAPRDGKDAAEENSDDWGETSSSTKDSEASSELDKKHRQALARDKLTRHTQGTEQVETVIIRTKQASKLLLRLSVAGAVAIFAIGIFSLPQIRELLNLTPFFSLNENSGENMSWHIYLLLFIPTTLMAALSITLWVTGLKFAAQLYGGANAPSEDDADQNDEQMTECLRLFQEVAKSQGTGPGS